MFHTCLIICNANIKSMLLIIPSSPLSPGFPTTRLYLPMSLSCALFEYFPNRQIVGAFKGWNQFHVSGGRLERLVSCIFITLVSLYGKEKSLGFLLFVDYQYICPLCYRGLSSHPVPSGQKTKKINRSHSFCITCRQISWFDRKSLYILTNSFCVKKKERKWFETSITYFVHFTNTICSDQNDFSSGYSSRGGSYTTWKISIIFWIRHNGWELSPWLRVAEDF